MVFGGLDPPDFLKNFFSIGKSGGFFKKTRISRSQTPFFFEVLGFLRGGGIKGVRVDKQAMSVFKRSTNRPLKVIFKGVTFWGKIFKKGCKN